MQAAGKYFYRCFSNDSAGGLVSGKGRSLGQLSHDSLWTEFNNHAILRARVPTALVSVSSRVIDTIQRAFNKHYNDRVSPDQIWIVFIHVLDVDSHVYHHGENLAQRWGLSKPEMLRYEYFFEWEISEQYVLHKVSVRMLLQRGFHLDEYRVGQALPSTREFREEFAKKNLHPRYGGYGIGLSLGGLARHFGARAPVRQIALQLQQDCCFERFVDPEHHSMNVSYWDDSSGIFKLDFSHFREIEDGINTALFDWWLADSQFVTAYQNHCVRASRLKEDIKRQWDVWYAATSANNTTGYAGDDETARRALDIALSEADAQIELEAIRLGL